MTTSDLASELEALAKDATPGPWSWTEDNGPKMPKQWRIAPGVLLADCSSGTPGGDSIDRANAALIVGLRNDIPAILSALRKAGEMEAALQTIGYGPIGKLDPAGDGGTYALTGNEWLDFRNLARSALKGTST